jgi:cell division protein FtsX
MSRLVNKTNQRVRQPFMFHYTFWAASGEVFGVPIVANCFKLLLKPI